MDNLATFAISLLPILVLVAFFVMLIDCYRHARANRPLWLLVIFAFSFFGYVFFYFSKDREK